MPTEQRQVGIRSLCCWRQANRVDTVACDDGTGEHAVAPQGRRLAGSTAHGASGAAGLAQGGKCPPPRTAPPPGANAAAAAAARAADGQRRGERRERVAPSASSAGDAHTAGDQRHAVGREPRWKSAVTGLRWRGAPEILFPQRRELERASAQRPPAPPRARPPPARRGRRGTSRTAAAVPARRAPARHRPRVVTPRRGEASASRANAATGAWRGRRDVGHRTVQARHGRAPRRVPEARGRPRRG